MSNTPETKEITVQIEASPDGRKLIITLTCEKEAITDSEIIAALEDCLEFQDEIDDSGCLH